MQHVTFDPPDAYGSCEAPFELCHKQGPLPQHDLRGAVSPPVRGLATTRSPILRARQAMAKLEVDHPCGGESLNRSRSLQKGVWICGLAATPVHLRSGGLRLLLQTFSGQHRVELFFQAWKRCLLGQKSWTTSGRAMTLLAFAGFDSREQLNVQASVNSERD